MRNVLTVLLAALLLVNLAGCAGDDESANDGDATEVGTTTSTGQTSEVGTNATGAAAANATQLTPELVFTAGAESGVSPVTINFTLEAVNATDLQNATWNVTAGVLSAEGTGLPALAELTFIEAGTYAVNATVFVDGVNLTARLTVEIEGGLPSGTLLDTTEWDGDGSLVTGFQWCGFSEGLDKGTHTWDAGALFSEEYVIQNIDLQFNVSPTAGAVRLDFYGPGGALIKNTSAGQIGGDGKMTIAGPLPAGQYQAIVKICTGVAVDYDFSMTAELVTP